MTTNKKAKRASGKAAFDRAFKARVMADTGRVDAVEWLASSARLSYNATSRVLNHRIPRKNSAGRELGCWLGVKKFLTADEIELLERLPYSP